MTQHHHVADYRVGVVEVRCNVAEDYLFHVSNYCLDAPFLIWREAFHTYSFVNALCGCDEDTNGLSVGRSIGGSPTINNEGISVGRNFGHPKLTRPRGQMYCPSTEMVSSL